MQRPGTIFLLSIILGALVAALAYRYLREQQSQVEMARRAASGATVDLVVANDAIPVGMRGMSVKVDNVTGVSGFITPNSRVDVLVSGTPVGGEDREQRSKLVLQNIRVLATGTSIEQKDEKPEEVPTVTLMVSPEDAE